MRNKKSDDGDLYDAFLLDPETMSEEDVADELAGAGDAAAALRERIAEMAKTLGADLRKAGIAAPPFLKDIPATLAVTDALPADEKLARSRAAGRLADLERRHTIPEKYELLEAARKGPGELASEDRDLLDAEAEDLRREVDTEHDETK
jgi:hypothetical protein